jgi:hypothetical protein
MVESRDLYGIPAPVAEKLEPLIPRINDILKHEPDFPHQNWHSQAVTRDALYAADMLDLDPEETRLTRLIAENHDEGYKLVMAGIINPDEHHFGSYVVAKSKYSDLTIAEGVLLHNQDVIPQDKPFPFCLVRDIDRLHFMGWGGVIRASYYLGFRPFNMTDHDPEKSMKAASLMEERTPDKEITKTKLRVDYCFPATANELVMQTDYERRAKIYSWLHVFPDLYRKGKLGELAGLCDHWLMAWVEGESYYKTPGNHFIPHGEKYDSDNVIYTTEPINEILQRMFGAKIFNTYDAQYAIEAWEKFHPQGILRKPKLEHKWARETYWYP